MLAVGTVGFVVDFGLFNLLVALGSPPNPANLVSIVVSATLVFLVNLRWTFDHRDVQLPHHSAARFVAVHVGSLSVVAIGVAIVTAFTSSVLIWNISKFLFTIGAGFVRFYLYREWVYTNHGRKPGGE